MAEISSITHYWAETGRTIICSSVAVKVLNWEPKIIEGWSREHAGEMLLRCIVKTLRWHIYAYITALLISAGPLLHTLNAVLTTWTYWGTENSSLKILRGVINLFHCHKFQSRGLILLILPLLHSHTERILTLASLSSNCLSSSQRLSHTSLFALPEASNIASLESNARRLSPAKACAGSLLFCTFPHESQYRSVQRNNNQVFHVIQLSSFPQIKNSFFAPYGDQDTAYK